MFEILWIRSLPLFCFSWIKLGCYVKNDWYKIRKICDIVKYLFIEEGLREGISIVAKRYAKPNNKCMNDYDPKKQSTFISYLDMNNLYGWAMIEYLPYEGFKWLKNVDKFDVMSIDEKVQ